MSVHLIEEKHIQAEVDVFLILKKILSNLLKYPFKISLLIGLSILDGFSNSYISQSFNQMLDYMLDNLDYIDRVVIGGKIGKVIAYFTGNLLFGQLRENLINSISEDIGEDFYNKELEPLAYKDKALVKMQTENTNIVDIIELKDRYKKSTNTILQFVSRTTSNFVYAASFFTVVGALSAFNSAAIVTSLSYASIGIALNLAGNLLEFILTNYYTEQSKNLKNANDNLKKFQMETNNDPIKFSQSGLDNSKKTAEQNLQNIIKEETRKLNRIKLFVDITGRFMIIFNFASKIGPDIFAIARKHVSMIGMFSKYVTNFGFELMTNNSKFRENLNQLNADMSLIGESYSKLHHYAKIKSNIIYSDDSNSLQLNNFSLKVPTKTSSNKDDQRILLKNINRNLECGKVHIIEGLTGSGKSTITLAIGGLHHLFDGQLILPDFYKNNPKAIQYVSQNGLQNISNRTLRQLLTDGIKPSSERSEESIKTELDELLDNLSLSQAGFKSKLDLPVGNPSGGEQKRLLIIKAILSRAKLIVIDEGLASLNNDVREKAHKLLKEYTNGEYKYYKNNKNTIISIQHRGANETDAGFGDMFWNIKDKDLTGHSR